MDKEALLKKIWAENELAVLARSRRIYDEIADLVKENQADRVFARLARAFRIPLRNWQDAALHVWSFLQDDFALDFPELDAMLRSMGAEPNPKDRETLRLWLWRRVSRSGNEYLLGSRIFADDHLFNRTLHDDRLVLWYGERQVEWPIQLLLGLLIGSRDHTKRLRAQLYWPTAKLPDNFSASRAENRVLRRLWEARILVRFGTWVHLHPLIMLLLPEISSFSSPVFEWREQELLGHMADGRRWPIPPFALSALVFDESLALFGRDRQRLWRNFSAYANDYLRRPDDVASNFVFAFFDELGLPAFRDAVPEYLTEFTHGIQFLETLRASI